MTFTELSENWLAQKKMELKPGTYETYCYLVRKILQENLGAISTKKLNQEKLDELFYILQTSKRKRTNQPLCKELILKSFSIVKIILMYGQKEKHCKKFTIVFKQLKKNDERESKVKFFEEDEYKKIIEYCMVKNTNNFYSLGILIGLFEGLRIGEICGLKWEDIDFIHKKMTINRTVRCSVNPETKKEEWIIGSPKTITSRRTIPINNEIIRILENLQKHKKYTGYIIRNKLQKEILNSPLPCRPDLLRKSFYQFLKDLEIPQRNFHCLRHTFASTAIRKGVSPKTVSEILGHSDVKITLNLYVHPNEEEKINCVNIFAKDVEEINAGTTSDSDGGSAVEPVTVVEGEKVVAPTAPTKEGLNFAGWLKGDAKYDFDTPVTGNITLKAKWSADPVYTVTLMDGTTKAKEVQVTKDDEYKVTLTATKVGYTLKAITSDKEGKTAVTFPLTVSDDTTLYAQFEINKYKVTFDVDGIEAQTVEYGKKATKPADPTKEGFTFKGWDFDFDKPVEKDVTVKAIWEEKAPEVEPTVVTLTAYPITLMKAQYISGIDINDFIDADTKLKKDEVYKFILKGAADNEIKNLKACLVDNAQDTNGGSSWDMVIISNEVTVAETIAANTEFNYEITLTVTKDQTGTGELGHRFRLTYENDSIEKIKIYESVEDIPDPNAQITEVVIKENPANCSCLATKEELAAILAEHSKAKFVLTFQNNASGGRNGWGCGVVEMATDPNDAYNSTNGTKLIEDYKPTELNATGDTETVEFKLDEVVEKIPDGGCVTANIWNDVAIIKVAVTY